MTLEHLLDLILGQVGVLVLLLFILVGGFRGWWVYGRYYDSQTKRLERVEQRLDTVLGTGDRLANSAERATRLVEAGRSEANGA